MFEPFDPIGTPTEEYAVQLAKSHIRGIIDSYHGEWDFLIELLQNAVDALDLRFNDPKPPKREKPHIEITINERVGTVRVSDNGVGMDLKQAKQALSPNFTDKPYYRATSSKRSLRGHKGVGLTFLAYNYNSLKYFTLKNRQSFSGEINGGKAWVDDEGNLPSPKVIPSSYQPEFMQGLSSGTSVEVLIGADFFRHVSMNWLGWHFIVRCWTAAGYFDVNELYPWNKEAIVTLKIIDGNGVKLIPPEGYGDDLPLQYLCPHEIAAACNLDDYFLKYPGRTEPPKTEKQKYEAIYIKWDTDKIESMIFSNGQELEQDTNKYTQYLFTRDHLPSVYAMFTHTASIWKDRFDIGYSNDKRRKFWKAGIQVITNQMPTGQIQEVSLPYRGGNKDRFLMFVEIPDAKPDYGRKGFKEEVVNYIQFLARELILRYLINNRGLLKPTAKVAHGPKPTDIEVTAQERIDQANSLPDLGFITLAFKKEPYYESDVVALFCELIGRQLIKGFDLLSMSSSGTQYDAVVTYSFTKNPEQLVYHPQTNPLGIPKTNMGTKDLPPRNLEFKGALLELIRDFEDGTKQAAQVRFAVTWDEGEQIGRAHV